MIIAGKALSRLSDQMHVWEKLRLNIISTHNYILAILPLSQSNMYIT